MMNKPKFKSGDRLLILKMVEIEIVNIDIDNNQNTTYLFKLVNQPQMMSVITEEELEKIITT